METRKLHHLAEPTHSGVLAPAKRPRDVDEEAGRQKSADAEVGDLKVGGQKDQVWSPNQEVLGHEAKTWTGG